MAIRAAELLVKIGADTAEAERGLGSVSSRLESAGKSAMATGGMLSLGVTAPLAGIATAALKTAIDYESALNLMQAVSGASAEQMAAVGAQAKALGADMTLPGTSADDAALAMVELAKAGLSVEQSMAAAKGVLQLSAAGAIDNARAAEIAANALNAFKLPGEEAANVANLLAAAANASSIEVTDAAGSFSMAAGVWSAFQGPAVGAKEAMTDLTTAVGILGNAGIKGSDAGTSLKQMLLQLTGPSSGAKDAMKALALTAAGASVDIETMNRAITGTAKERREALAALAQAAGPIGDIGDIAFDASGKMRPLNEIIDLVARGTANLTEEQRAQALTTIFGADATRAVIGLMREGAEGFANMEAAVTREGAAADVAGARTKGLGGALEGLQSQLKTVMLEVAEPFLGMLEGAARGVADLVGGLTEIDPNLRNAALAFAAVLAAAGPVVLAFGVLATAIGFVLSPLGLVVVAVAAFAAAYASNFLGVRDITNTVVGGIMAFLGGLITFVQQILSGNWAGAWETAKGAAQSAWDGIQAGIGAAWDAISGLITAGLDTVGEYLAGAWEGIKDTASTAWTAIADFFRDWWQTILFGIITGGLGPLVMFIAGNWDTIKEGAATAWEGIKTTIGTWVTNAYNAVVETLRPLPGWIGGRWGEISSAAEDTWKGFSATVTDWVTTATDNVVSAITAALDFIKAGPSAWMEAGKALIKALVEGIRSISIPVPTFQIEWVSMGKFSIPRLDIGIDYMSLGELIPALAAGGRILAPGMALVGEAGPELLSLPRGAEVAPLPRGGRGAPTIVVNVYPQGSVIAERDLAQTIRRELLQVGRRNLSVGLT
ncbi:MAG: phage tail tape measure protein [Chloroflexi bacterium]|nr:phage tail tape measure protein [Chloroflexota bacterium]